MCVCVCGGGGGWAVVFRDWWITQKKEWYSRYSKYPFWFKISFWSIDHEYLISTLFCKLQVIYLSKIGRKNPAQAHFHTSNLSEHCSSKHDFFSQFFHIIWKVGPLAFHTYRHFFIKLYMLNLATISKVLRFFWDTRYIYISSTDASLSFVRKKRHFN